MPASMDTVESLLSRIRVLRDAPAYELERVVDRLIRKRLASKEYALVQDDRGDRVFFVLSGTLAVILYSPEGKEVFYREFHAGETFGDYSAIDGGTRAASIRAITEAEVVSLPAEDFLVLLARCPEVATEEMRQLVRAIRTLTQRVYELSVLASDARLRAELGRLAEKDPENPNALTIARMPTQAQLAARVGTHREAISRHIVALERAGLLLREGRRARIPDAAAFIQGVAEPLSLPPVVGQSDTPSPR